MTDSETENGQSYKLFFGKTLVEEPQAQKVSKHSLSKIIPNLLHFLT